MVFIFQKSILAFENDKPIHVDSLDNIYPSKYSSGSFGYILKTWRDNVILLLTFNDKSKAELKLTNSFKRLLEAQTIAESGKCRNVNNSLVAHQLLITDVSKFIHKARQDNQEINILTNRIYKTMPLINKISQRINFFCPQEGKRLFKSLANFNNEAEDYWGIKQLMQFHEQMNSEGTR